MTNPILAIGLPSGMEWIVILAIAVLIFGRRLPDIARGLGKSIAEFKKGIKDAESEVKKSLHEPAPPTDEASKKEPPKTGD